MAKTVSNRFWMPTSDAKKILLPPANCDSLRSVLPYLISVRLVSFIIRLLRSSATKRKSRNMNLWGALRYPLSYSIVYENINLLWRVYVSKSFRRFSSSAAAQQLTADLPASVAECE